MNRYDGEAGQRRFPLVVSRRASRLSPWVELLETRIQDAPTSELRIFHSMGQADYVGILALTPDGRVPLVRQFRPAVQTWSLELPAGLLEEGEAPGSCAVRELEEETGFTADELVPLGTLHADTGRLSNRLHGFLGKQVRPLPDWRPEDDVIRELIDLDRFLELIATGRFLQALHIALVGLALTRGLLPRR